jgi:tRNA nucleotidyltransferase/poly(A) polymerase
MEVSYIIERLCDCGYHAYITGGAVRDALAGLPSKDEDIVTNATPEEIEKVFLGHDVKFVGKQFLVTLVDGVEVATYRKDTYGGFSDKNCEVSFVETLGEDLGRRDITINSLAYCEYTGEVIDLYGGQDDLKKKIIKFVNNPKERIHEDPNRIIRACRFLAKIDGRFECKTFEALCEYSHYVRDYVAKERIRLEILKALELPKPSLFFQALFEINALQYIFPSMIPCADHHHGKHHREDIFTHLMIVGDSISPKYPLLRLSGYLHDVGKPESYSDDGKFINHENVGAEIIIKELQDLRFSIDEVSKVSNLIKCHMYSIKDISPKSIRKLLVFLNELGLNYSEFLRLRIADRIGNLAKPNFTLKEIKEVLLKFKNVINEKTPFSVKSLMINGDDVMNLLNLVPGKKVGEILKMLFEYVLENGPEYNTREKLLEQLREMG